MKKAVKFKDSAAPVNRKWPQWYYVLRVIWCGPKVGLTTKEVADRCGISYDTFQHRQARLYREVRRWVRRERQGQMFVWLCRDLDVGKDFVMASARKRLGA